LAKVAGALYLTIFVCGLFSEVVVRSTLFEPGDGAATVSNLLSSPALFRIGLLADLTMVACDVAIGVVVYRLLAIISPTVSMVAAAFRLAQAAVLGAGLVHYVMALQLLHGDGLLGGFDESQRDTLVLQRLEAHRFAYLIALVFFAVHLALLAWLVARSGFLPRVGAVLLAAGAVGYLVDSLMFFTVRDYGGSWSPLVLAPAVVAEFAVIGWLLLRGPDQAKWEAANL
jgi:hypothetical protein